ncbi:MAG: hypothetical protein DWQ42_21040 [Planctomycetota bacterium]|nr:MAG: hypothetical protein DWQ42_21040 [Planctomycetota bacterium]REK42320.1 MAG: hypothetical protein DWQ46_13700 [Planctomycetota bacterium]
MSKTSRNREPAQTSRADLPSSRHNGEMIGEDAQPPHERTATNTSRPNPWRRGALALVALAGCATLAIGADWYLAVPKTEVASYVGRQTCAECHQQEVQAWTGSHHDRAMDLATPETVLGDFDDAVLEYQGVTSKMFRRDGAYFINTEGPDGQLADFPVKYVIGVEPLQQYMVEFPDGRVQVLRITWDTAGKRWFYHYPPDVKDERLAPDDPLHWTGEQSNWNYMCADCHTTNLKKNFDAATETYHTSFSEIDVSCETCHGPGSIHVELAHSRSLFWDRNHGYGLARLKGESNKAEVESCAKCHMRRSQQLTENFRPGGELCDHFAPARLRAGLYHDDGQIKDEVYVYGSFAQSKMFARGIRCTDCHDPHTARLKHQGNAVCTSCHQHPSAKYDTPAHHHHAAGSSGAQCVECHMPEKHFMIVDPRRDHSMRAPRPDLSVAWRTPNACTGCHLELELEKEGGHDARPHYADWLAEAEAAEGEARERITRLDRWAAEHHAKWYDTDKSRDRKSPWIDFGPTLAAARQQQPEALSGLRKLLARKTTPAIVRATALEALGNHYPETAFEQLCEALTDKSPLVRATALTQLAQLPAGGDHREATPVPLAAPLLADPVRLVRIEAARSVAPYLQHLDEEERTQFDRAAAELVESFAVANDRAGSHRELAKLQQHLGQFDKAKASLSTALRLSRTPLDKSLSHYQNALLLVRQRDFAAVERELLAALEASEENIPALQTLLALYFDLRRPEQAREVLNRWRKRAPGDPRLNYWQQQLDAASSRPAASP